VIDFSRTLGFNHNVNMVSQ